MEEYLMKHLLLIMLALVVSICMMPMAFAGEHGDPADCAGLDGEALELCTSYCVDKMCNADDPNGNPKSCAKLKENYTKVTGEDYLPCDTISCALCADPDPTNLLNTIGECVEIKAIDCVEPALAVGEIPCDLVMIPTAIDRVTNPNGIGCDNIDPNNILGPMYPDCQNGMPGFVCTMFLGGTVIDECPAPPSCFE